MRQYLHAERLLGLDQLALEQFDERVALTGMQGVIAQFDNARRSAGRGRG